MLVDEATLPTRLQLELCVWGQQPHVVPARHSLQHALAQVLALQSAQVIVYSLAPGHKLSSQLALQGCKLQHVSACASLLLLLTSAGLRTSSSGRGMPSMSGSLGATSARRSAITGVPSSLSGSVQCACAECAATAKACVQG